VTLANNLFQLNGGLPVGYRGATVEVCSEALGPRLTMCATLSARSVNPGNNAPDQLQPAKATVGAFAVTTLSNDKRPANTIAMVAHSATRDFRDLGPEITGLLAK
jgi:hypothetical protein